MFMESWIYTSGFMLTLQETRSNQIHFLNELLVFCQSDGAIS